MAETFIKPTGDICADEIRREIASRVRLKVREERRWYFWTVFHVIGQQSDLDGLEMALETMRNKNWWARQW